jgi:hypothetical protein
LFDGLEQPVTVSSQRPWQGVEEVEPVATPWAQLSCEGPVASSTAKLPVNCPTCGRPLIRHAVTDPHGRRWLIATCDLHHEAGRVRW